jgi:hypothetical protein
MDPRRGKKDSTARACTTRRMRSHHDDTEKERHSMANWSKIDEGIVVSGLQM